MKCKLIILLIALLIPTFGFAQQSIQEKKIDDIIARIKQIQQDSPDAERQLQRLLEELNMDIHSPMAMRELVRQDAPEELQRRQLQLLIERYGSDHHDRRTESRSSLPLTTADNQPMTAAQQAVIAQVLEDFQVNENVEGCDQWEPAVAVDGGGNFVVVWHDERNGNDEIYAQRYNSNGVPQGDNFRVNDDVAMIGRIGWYSFPAIACDGDGNFVVVWEDYRNGNYDIYAQRFSISGAKQGTNFRVNDDSGSSDQDDPAIACDGGGNFVVVWVDERNDYYGDIYAQRFSISGAKQGTNFRVNDDSGSSDQYDPAIACDGCDNFVVVWEDYRNGNYNIYAQRFSISGAKQGTNFRVNDDSGSSYQGYSTIACDEGGNFVVVWHDDRNGNYDIYAQRYNSNGVPQGDNFRVNGDSGSSNQGYPAIACDRGGNFVVVWQHYRNGNYDIYAQLFDFQGHPNATNYQVNNDTGTKEQLYPDVKFVNGHIYYTWQDNRIEGQGWDIFARVDKFNVAPAAPGLSSPANNSTITKDKPALTFTVPADNNNDPLHFKVEIASNSSFSNHISGSPFESQINSTGFNPTPPVPQGSGTCSFTVPSPLENGDYWWRVSAYDGNSYSVPSESWKFTIDVKPIYIKPVIAEHQLHEEYFVDIQIEEVQNLFGVAFKLNFPANKLEALAAQGGDFLGTDPLFFPNIDNTNGMVSIGATKKSGQESSNGTGIVARIKLKEKPSVISGETIQLSLTEVSANDPSGNVITLTPRDTSYVTSSPSSELTVTPANVTIGSVVNSQGSFNITSNVNWSITDNADWLTASPTSGSNNGTITVTATSANENTNSRYATVTVTGSGISREVTVTQSGGSPYLTITPTNLTLGASGNSEKIINVNANVSWSVSEDASWLNITPMSSSGNDTVTVTATSANTSTSSRSDTLFFSGSGINRAVWVTQSGIENTAPAIPQLVSPADNSNPGTNQPELRWNVPTDSEGDALHFKVEIATDLNFINPIYGSPFESTSNTAGFSPTPPVNQGNGECSFMVPFMLNIGEYYWRVSAWDGSMYGQNSLIWKFVVTPSGVEIGSDEIPTEFSLYPNYPNPFNPTTTITYALPEQGHVKIEIFDLTGRLVKKLVDAAQQPGVHSITWDARDDAGKEVANGLYICRMTAGNEVLNQKMILAK